MNVKDCKLAKNKLVTHISHKAIVMVLQLCWNEMMNHRLIQLIKSPWNSICQENIKHYYFLNFYRPFTAMVYLYRCCHLFFHTGPLIHSSGHVQTALDWNFPHILFKNAHLSSFLIVKVKNTFYTWMAFYLSYNTFKLSSYLKNP